MHFYGAGGQNALQYTIDIKVTVMNVTTPKNLQDIFGIYVLAQIFITYRNIDISIYK
jgi:hypothetical protein